MIIKKVLALALLTTCVLLSYSMTPDQYLLDAACNGNLNQAEEALLNGADINTRNNTYATALHRAALLNRIAVVAFLLEHGADVNAQNYRGTTPLHYAASRGHEKVAKLLINAGANVNAQDYEGATPLYHAAQYRHRDIVMLLLDCSANILLKNKEGKTALEAVRAFKNVDIYPIIKSNKQVIIDLLENYLSIQKEAHEKPTKKTLNAAIKSAYLDIDALVLKRGIVADKNDLKLAKQLNRKKIGSLLIVYLGATSNQNRISKVGITGVRGITADIAQHIISSAL